jgi:hypothetical protein
VLVGNGTAVAAAVSGTDFKTINSTSILGSGNISITSTPGGSTTQVQYNNAGAFAGSANFVFDGTNVGIGTSSPGEKLHVVGGGATTSTVNFTGGSNNDNATIASDYSLNFQIDANNNVGGRVFNWRYGGKGYSDGTELMTLNSSGNLGLGVTPSAWGFAGAMQLKNAAIYGSGTQEAGVYANAYYNAGWKYITGGQAAGYVQNNGHQWFVAGTGTAGNAITFTQAMTLSSAGGFSVGTTANPGAGAIYATGAITAFYSDRRLKDVKGTIINALDKVASLSGVYYTNNEVAVAHGYTSTETQVGLLAQDVEAVLPEVVKAAPFDLDEKGHSKSGEHYKTIQYERVIPLLVEAIKELRAEIQALRG